ncbi:hypothetical protein XU18_3047 [Perkinsela sp. CCAP 1560/4]|nr:hypothetical protein XU18_3047 [Perkinsela sp. CCAP 1560/4]|eukprot:KNH06110.1 hypothetical protein XU18_3047 [Perkinsela sp. CCAP 1560/4]
MMGKIHSVLAVVGCSLQAFENRSVSMDLKPCMLTFISAYGVCTSLLTV